MGKDEKGEPAKEEKKSEEKKEGKDEKKDVKKEVKDEKKDSKKGEKKDEKKEAKTEKKGRGRAKSVGNTLPYDETAGPVMLEGELTKQGARGIKTWKKRTFILQNGVIRYFDRMKETGSIEGSSIIAVTAKKNFDFDISTPLRDYHLRAHDEEARQYWIKGILKFCDVEKNAMKSNAAAKAAEKNEISEEEEEDKKEIKEEKKEEKKGEKKEEESSK